MKHRPLTTGVAGAFRGTLTLALAAINTVAWAIPIYLGALLRPALPRGPVKDALRRGLNALAENWIRVNNTIMRVGRTTDWEIRGLEGLRREGRYLVISNHQSWADILVLQKAFSGSIPFLKFFIKQELIWVPVLGLAWWALEFPFMKRYSSAFLEKHPEMRGKDLETTRKMCEAIGNHPLTIMNFLEGTRFDEEKRAQQNSPYRCLLRPKAGGIAFVLGAIGSTLDSLLDVTIVYEGRGLSLWDFVCGRVDKVIVDVRKRDLPDHLFAGDYHSDDTFRDQAQDWVRQLWEEKDIRVAALRRAAALALAVLLGVTSIASAAGPETRPADPAMAERYDVALRAYEEKRFGDARIEFESLASSGVPQAEFMLAVLYEFGDGVAPSYAEAAHWYGLAADKGLTSAETRLGHLTLEGKGVPPDPLKARSWFERAARKGDPAALMALGDLYARGRGVTQSPEEAYAYYVLAEEQGSESSAERLVDLNGQLSAARREQFRARARRLAATLASAGAEEGAATSQGTAKLPPLGFRTESLADPQLGGRALYLLVPDNWKVSGGVAWDPATSPPASVEIEASSPTGQAFVTFPRDMYAWHFEAGNGQKPFLGIRGYESKPPVGDAIVYLERVILPRRSEFRGANIVERQVLPAFARVVGSELSRGGARVDVSAARVRISYSSDGRQMEADLFCVLSQSRSPAGGAQVIIWGPEYLYAYRAPAGKLDASGGILDTVAASLRFDDLWWARYESLLEELGERPGRSRITDREFDLFLLSAKNSHAAAGGGGLQREARRARINGAFATEFARTEIYFDADSEREIVLPKGYARAWVSNLGGYELSSEPDTTPLTGDPKGEWLELHAVRSR